MTPTDVTTESILEGLQATTTRHAAENTGLWAKATTTKDTAIVVTPGTILLNAPTGARVKWHVTTPGTGVLGTLFGRVVQEQSTPGLLLVTEETSGRAWALNPTTDHITVLS
jgi:hypothetical protein